MGVDSKVGYNIIVIWQNSLHKVAKPFLDLNSIESHCFVFSSTM